MRSRQRYEIEKIRELEEKGLDEIILDYGEIEITEEDKNIDYVSRLPEILSAVRNDYAHGSKTLNNHALSTFVIVSEIINQLYKDQ